MTYIATPSLSVLNLDNSTKEYMIEVVTFDGESEIVYVEASNEDEAQSLAASEVENADYTMVQGCW